MKPIIIFDLDGVLINSLMAHAEAYNFAFEKHGLKRRHPQEIINLLGPPAEVIIDKLFPVISSRKISAIAISKSEFLLTETIKLVRMIYGTEDTLEELRKKFRIALVSNARSGEISALLAAGKVDENLFDIVIGADDIKNHKPAPDAVYAVEKEDEGKVEWVVGDQTVDILMGKAAHKKTIAVLSGVDTFAKLHAVRPDAIIQNVTLVPDVVLGKL